MVLNEKFKEHTKRGGKFLIASSLIGASSYAMGIVFVDFFGFSYWFFGILITPYSLLLRYLTSHIWVWK